MIKRENNHTMERVRQLFGKTEPLSAYDVADTVFLDVKNARFYCRILHSNGEVHIERWDKRPHGPPVPVYRIGTGKDAKRPAMVTDEIHAQKNRIRMRNNRKNLEFRVKERAKSRAARQIKKSSDAPSLISFLAATLTARKTHRPEATF